MDITYVIRFLWNRQRQVLLPLAVATAVNGFLNLMMIPRYGIEGAAVATLLAETILVVWCGALHYHLTAYLPVIAAPVHGLVAIVSALVAAFLSHWFVGETVPAPWGFLVGPALAGTLYGALVLPWWWRRLSGPSRSVIAVEVCISFCI